MRFFKVFPTCYTTCQDGVSKKVHGREMCDVFSSSSSSVMLFVVVDVFESY